MAPDFDGRPERLGGRRLLVVVGVAVAVGVAVSVASSWAGGGSDGFDRDAYVEAIAGRDDTDALTLEDADPACVADALVDYIGEERLRTLTPEELEAGDFPARFAPTWEDAETYAVTVDRECFAVTDFMAATWAADPLIGPQRAECLADAASDQLVRDLFVAGIFYDVGDFDPDLAEQNGDLERRCGIPPPAGSAEELELEAELLEALLSVADLPEGWEVIEALTWLRDPIAPDVCDPHVAEVLDGVDRVPWVEVELRGRSAGIAQFLTLVPEGRGREAFTGMTEGLSGCDGETMTILGQEMIARLDSFPTPDLGDETAWFRAAYYDSGSEEELGQVDLVILRRGDALVTFIAFGDQPGSSEELVETYAPIASDKAAAVVGARAQ